MTAVIESDYVVTCLR